MAWIELDTIHIPGRDTTHRSRFYRKPLEDTSAELGRTFETGGDELASVIQQGLLRAWPMNDPTDDRAIARMLRRIRAEQVLRRGRTIAGINMATLDVLAAMIVAEATAVRTARNIGHSAGGSTAVLPPGLDPGGSPSSSLSTSALCPLTHLHGFS